MAGAGVSRPSWTPIFFVVVFWNPEGTKVKLLGDLNARTANLKDDLGSHFDPHKSITNNSANESIPQRRNKDGKINGKGRPFIDAIATNELVILNGRTLGEIFGEYTCYKHNGASTVDYICVSADMFSKVSKFEVKSLKHISDHRPVAATLDIGSHNKILKNPLSLKFDDAPLGYKWCNSEENNSIANFSEAQGDTIVKECIERLSVKHVNNKEDVNLMNSELVNLYQLIASRSLQKKKNCSLKRKKKWFDHECRTAKRKLCCATNKFDKNPLDEQARTDFYEKKRQYADIKKEKKYKFEFEANKEIESGGKLDWKSFKKLKSMNDEGQDFDLFDLQNLYIFFKDLYKKRCEQNKHGENESTVEYPSSDQNISILNKSFTIDEINIGIKKLKSNKSVSLDLISNEMFKNSSTDMRKLILKLFNHCLDHGAYPWSESITTPLHKKGDLENPDNYRAITLGSCLGKLFASALLERLISYREIHCPDPPNQLGFCRGSQTSDHILTLKTIIEKYVTRGKTHLLMLHRLQESLRSSL